MGRRTVRAALSGTLAGTRLALKSYEPSLMPRSAIDQGLAAGGSFLVGFMSGVATSAALEVFPGFATGPLLRVAGIVATGSRTATNLASGSADAIDPEQIAWIEFGSEIIAAVALSRMLTSDRSPVASTAALAGFGIATTIDASNIVATRIDQPDPKYLATSAGVAVSAGVAFAGVIGVVRLGSWFPRRALRGRPLISAVAGVLGTATAIGVISRVARSAMASTIAKMSSGNQATEIAYGDRPESRHVSGGPASAIAYDTLGVQGRRLVSSVVTADDVRDVMGEVERREPVRVYVGIASERDHQALVDAAIADLDRLGGFDRSTIIAAAPAGTGYVNYIAVEAAELMARGDCATVAIQYGSVPSILSLHTVGTASDLFARLLRRLRAELESRSSSAKLVAYGESLGATAGQAGVDSSSDAGKGPIVDRALWVGTPKGSPLFDRLVSMGTPVFDAPADLDRFLASASAPPHVLLSHHSDPVTKFTAADAYRMPAWLKQRDRGRGTEPAQRWLPGVSFFQGLIDTKNAATVVPGEFSSSGHDYRADLASFIRVAFGFDDVTADQMARIEGHLRQSEVARAKAIALGTLHTA